MSCDQTINNNDLSESYGRKNSHCFYQNIVVQPLLTGSLNLLIKQLKFNKHFLAYHFLIAINSVNYTLI